ncbi:39S ribosomal protein L21, mitochondrial [Phlebotomus papatasi]|uniref:39S ribosomal protein L21, mitochondrial n=1 Tax=Phlebotomus papatasi TaxID=29031 RepID=UPI0024845DE5|nr:39S ribosomal protein L21, mitochondrial [Phlebotomus papatasi]
MLLNRLCSSQFRSSIIGLTNSLKSLSFPQTAQFSSKIASDSVAAAKDLSTDVSSNQKTIERVNQQLAAKEEGRLFAVVHLCGKQFKVTSGDIIVVEGGWPPDAGDKIRLDKVLAAGGKDFSLIGRPIVQKGLVNVQATVIEKTLSHTRTNFRMRKRKQYRRVNFHRNSNTMIRINSISIMGRVNEDLQPEPEIPRIF